MTDATAGFTRRATLGALAIGATSQLPSSANGNMQVSNAYAYVVSSLGEVKRASVNGGAVGWRRDDGISWFTWLRGDYSNRADDANVVASDHVELSNGAWVRQDVGRLSFRRPSSTAFRRSLDDVVGDIEVSLFDYGVSPTSSPAENLARLKIAIAECPAGARLRLPPTAPLIVTFDTSGGLSKAAVIDKRLHLVVDGDMKANFSAVQTNPPFILNITEPGVVISGTGRILGDGVIHDANDGTDETIPGLIRVDADNVTISGVEIVSPPKVGILLYQCFRSRIDGVKFTGGPIEYRDTGYFALRAAGGGGHILNGNRFYPDENNGMFVQCIFFSGSNDNIISANTALRPYEKLVYGFGSRNIASANIVIGNTGFIPGTNMQGTITGVIRFHGDDNKIDNNLTSHCAGGAQCMDGKGNQVTNNKFLECGQTALSIYQAVLTNTKVSNNICTHGRMAGFVVGDGIRIVASGGPSRQLSVDGNTVVGFSGGDPVEFIPTWKPGASYAAHAIVKPGTGNGRYYRPQKAGGKSGRGEPNWPDDLGATVTDGSITWVAYAFEGGQAAIKVEGAGRGMEITDSAITGNNTSGARLGLVTNHVVRSKIALNKFDSSDWGMTENNGADNRWELNDVVGTVNVGVRNIAASSTLFNYLKGEYAPDAGDGVVASGKLTLLGRWEQTGRKIKVTVRLDAGGILIPASGSKRLCALPRPAAFAGVGVHWNSSLTVPGTTLVMPAAGEEATLFASPLDATADLPNGPATLIADIEYEVV